MANSLSNHGIDFFNNVRKMNQRVVACDEFDRVFEGTNEDESKMMRDQTMYLDFMVRGNVQCFDV